MEGEENNLRIEVPCPILYIPKQCTTLETNCDLTENVFIHLDISSPDTDGNEATIYKGLCNVKVVEGQDINIGCAVPDTFSNIEDMPVIFTESNQLAISVYNDSQVWIDPVRSPFVYNRCDSLSLDTYPINESTDNQTTSQQHNTNVTETVYSDNEANTYPSASEGEKTVKVTQENVQNLESFHLYDQEELECGMFLSQMSEEINVKAVRAHEENKFVGLKTENEALKQLMSTDIQFQRQQKTILFLAHNSLSGQTIQNIAINDPSLQCTGAGEMDYCVNTIVENNINEPRTKKYQCNKCKQIFDQLSAFKQHVVSSHRLPVSGNLKYMCSECGKSLRSQEKFELHCLGHGDPDLECNKCHKVFATKFTLRNHIKIHSRQFPCSSCAKCFETLQELNAHASKVHDISMCKICFYVCETRSELHAHVKLHSNLSDSSTNYSDADFDEGVFDKISDTSETQDIIKHEEEGLAEAHLETHDSVIAKVMSNTIFQKSKQTKKSRKYNKSCEVCFKTFDRIGDLKRHLIEHVIRSTLAKNPVNKYGVLNIRCEICQKEVFTKVDKYKAHLREHAKLTLYKCTFCDKSFSDSSNFSKHKKIHGVTYFQCDMCQRKFNSKKMLTQHMEYHNKNRPIECQHCKKVFHFESMLRKHLKSSHTKETISKSRCRFCRQSFSSLKEKWDHEWSAHNVRKVIMDCLTCGARFRKYSELKRHCSVEHNTIIPPAKKFQKWRFNEKLKIMEEAAKRAGPEFVS